MKVSHTKQPVEEPLCRTLGAKPRFSDPTNSSPTIIMLTIVGHAMTDIGRLGHLGPPSCLFSTSTQPLQRYRKLLKNNRGCMILVVAFCSVDIHLFAGFACKSLLHHKLSHTHRCSDRTGPINSSWPQPDSNVTSAWPFLSMWPKRIP